MVIMFPLRLVIQYNNTEKKYKEISNFSRDDVVRTMIKKVLKQA